MLKAELHTHTNKDPVDGAWIKHTPKQLIDDAVAQGFQVLAFTYHRTAARDQESVAYAKKKGLLLIMGCEAVIEGKEVLLYNVAPQDIKPSMTWNDLRLLKKKKEILVIAPHPYFPVITGCLQDELEKHIDLFDAIEYSYFYLSWWNYNTKAEKIAKKYHKSMVGNSDVHLLEQLGLTYTWIDAKPTMKGVFKAIRDVQVRIETKPLSPLQIASIFTRILLKKG
ncbi:PHP domain-containing protein [Candidatus Woesearchaeota archaeon]|nr:PHP domain-containing protein [Candidatus Woesearchaeota archaeon]